MEIAYSMNHVPIRLTEERWEHIVSNKPYLSNYADRILQTIETPSWILRGYAGTKIAVRMVAKQSYLHVVYKEISQHDGFILTAFIARKYNDRMIVWPPKS